MLIREIYVCAPFSTLGYSIFYSIPYTRAIFLYAFAARPFRVLVFFRPFFLFLAKELHAENLFWFVRRNCWTKMQTTGQLIKNIEIFFNWIAIFVRLECTWQCCGDLFQVSIGLAHIVRTSISAATESMCKHRDIQTQTHIQTHTQTHIHRVHRTNALGLNFYFQFDSLLVFFFVQLFPFCFFAKLISLISNAIKNIQTTAPSYMHSQKIHQWTWTNRSWKTKNMIFIPSKV